MLKSDGLFDVAWHCYGYSFIRPTGERMTVIHQFTPRTGHYAGHVLVPAESVQYMTGLYYQD